jgi:hypothetical protein
VEHPRLPDWYDDQGTRRPAEPPFPTRPISTDGHESPAAHIDPEIKTRRHGFDRFIGHGSKFLTDQDRGSWVALLVYRVDSAAPGYFFIFRLPPILVPAERLLDHSGWGLQ